MNKEPLILGIIGIIVLIATVGVLTLSAGNNSNGTANSQCNMTDEQFIQHMVPHHEQAIAMAQIAQEKSEHNEVKQLAGNIISTQSSEIFQMREWHKNWYGKDIPVNSSNMNTENCNISHDGSNGMNHTMETMENMTDLESLKNADQFDKAFLEQMIAHHEMAVMMAQGVLNSERPEVRALAESIIKTQSAEIDQMKKWLNEWYGSGASTSSSVKQSSSNSNQAASTSSNNANVDHASHHSTPTSSKATSVSSNTSEELSCHEE